MMGTDEASRVFASAMAQALRQLDHDGRVTATNVLLLRRAIAATPLEHRLGVVMKSERYVGAFEPLPKASREAIVRAIQDRDRWHVAVGGWRRALRARLGQGRLGSSANRLMVLSLTNRLQKLSFMKDRDRMGMRGHGSGALSDGG